jgi:flavin-binding protein dodecin
MPDRTYKLIEIVGVSEESVGQAVKNAIARTGASLKGLGWFEVTQIRGLIRDDAVSQFQVTVKVGFRVLSVEEVKKAKRARKPTAGEAPDTWIDDHF